MNTRLLAHLKIDLFLSVLNTFLRRPQEALIPKKVSEQKLRHFVAASSRWSISFILTSRWGCSISVYWNKPAENLNVTFPSTSSSTNRNNDSLILCMCVIHRMNRQPSHLSSLPLWKSKKNSQLQINKVGRCQRWYPSLHSPQQMV